MKQLLISFVAVLLGSTAISSYAEDDYKQRQGAKTINVLSEGSKELEIRRLFGDEESNSDVNEDGKKINARPVIWCDQTLKS